MSAIVSEVGRMTSGAPSAGGEILDPRMRVERMETEVAVRLFFIWMACYVIYGILHSSGAWIKGGSTQIDVVLAPSVS
jgi:hypothetical protein